MPFSVSRFRPLNTKRNRIAGLALLLHMLFSLSARAQYEYLLHKPYPKNIEGYSRLYLELIALKDSAAIARKTEDIKRFARNNNDRGLELEMDLFTNYYNIEFRKCRSPQCVAAMKQLINKADKENALYVKLRAIRVLADYYWTCLKDYELAFEQYLLLDKAEDNVSAADYPEKPRDLMKIGEAYYFFQDYTPAERYFKKALAVPENDFNTMVLNSARNTLGLCYQKEQQYDSAYYYFNQVVQTGFAKPKQEWVRIAKGNIGANYYYLGEYDKAIPLLEEDFNGAEAINDYGPAAGAAILLGDIYLHKGAEKLSWHYIALARDNINRADQPDRLQYWYPVVSKWYSAGGNEILAQAYLDSTIMAINAYQRQFSALKMMQAQQKINLKEHQLQKARLELEHQKQKLLIIVAVCLIIFIALVYRIQRRKRQHIELEKQHVERDLQQARREIDRFIQKISGQNNLVDKINTELQKIKNSESDEQKILEQTILELRSATILTSEDWRVFKQNFTTVYPDFVSILTNKYPSITESEMRYLMLTKLQLSHKEMAHVLGISPDAVRVTWNRTRKKLGGTLEDTPRSLIQIINNH